MRVQDGPLRTENDDYAVVLDGRVVMDGVRVARFATRDEADRFYAAADAPSSSVGEVPVAANGLEGWTSCCGAAVTYSGAWLCCRACWGEVDAVHLDGEVGEALGVIVGAVIAGTLSADEGVERQRALLALPREKRAGDLAVGDFVREGVRVERVERTRVVCSPRKGAAAEDAVVVTYTGGATATLAVAVRCSVLVSS